MVRFALLLLLLCSLSVAAELTESIELRGTVVDQEEKPAAESRVVFLYDPAEHFETVTDADGKFSLSIPEMHRSFIRLAAFDAERKHMALLSRSGSNEPLDNLQIVLQPPREFSISVVDADKKPIRGAMVRAVLNFAQFAEEKTDEQGRATIRVPADVTPQYLYATLPDVGFDYVIFLQPHTPARHSNWLEPDHRQLIEFVLRGVQPLRFRVTDNEDRPLVGVQLRPGMFSLPGTGGGFNTIWQSSITDETGRCEFRAIPKQVFEDNEEQLANARFSFSASKDRYARTTGISAKNGANEEIVIKLVPQVSLFGSVEDGAGKPAAGVEVSVAGGGNSQSFYRKIRTNEGGKFEVYVDQDKAYSLVASREKEFSPPELIVVPGRQFKLIPLKLEPATRIVGQLVSQKGDPIANESISLMLHQGEDYALLPAEQRLPGNSTSVEHFLLHRRETVTDAAGQFEFFVGRGRYQFRASCLEPSNAVTELTGQTEVNILLKADRPFPVPLAGRVTAKKDGAKLSGATINGVAADFSSESFAAVCDPDGSFKTKRIPKLMLVTARTADNSLAGYGFVGDDASEVDIELQPTASVKGRLLDAETGLPLAKETVEFSCVLRGSEGGTQSHLFYGNFHGSGRTDEKGNFTLPGLMVGMEYSLNVVSFKKVNGQLQQDRAKLLDLQPKRAEEIDAGKLKAPKEP